MLPGLGSISISAPVEDFPEENLHSVHLQVFWQLTSVKIDRFEISVTLKFQSLTSTALKMWNVLQERGVVPYDSNTWV